MSKTVLLVGTRKASSLRATRVAGTQSCAGLFCEGWPIYHAIHDAGSGTIYAAAASEWHGASVWRSPDRGETWEQSSEGLNYGEDGELKLSKVSGLTATDGRLLAGAEMPGVFESRDGGETWKLWSTLDGHPDRDSWNDPKNQPPGHLGVPAILAHPDDAARFFAIVQGIGIFETTDDGSRGRRATRGCGPTGRSSTTTWASACTSSSAHRRTATASTSRTTWACTAQTTARSLDGDHGGPARSSASPPPPTRTTATPST